MKKIHVKNYQVLINEEKSSCGVAINVDYYKKIKIDNEDLSYKVFYKENKITINNKKIQIILHGCDKEFLYYAIKTDGLGVILGGENLIKQQLMAEIRD